MIYLYLFGTCFHFIYVFMIIGNETNIKANRFLLYYKRYRRKLLYRFVYMGTNLETFFFIWRIGKFIPEE